MPLVDAVCPHCGAPLKVNPDAKTLTCRYCGNEFVVQDAINNVNVNIENSQINNNFNGATVYINGETIKEEKNIKGTRPITITFKHTNLLSGYWECSLDNKVLCEMSVGEWEDKISTGDHIISVKLYGDGMIQITNTIKIEAGDSPLKFRVKNKIFGAPIIEQL